MLREPNDREFVITLTACRNAWLYFLLHWAVLRTLLFRQANSCLSIKLILRERLHLRLLLQITDMINRVRKRQAVVVKLL